MNIAMIPTINILTIFLGSSGPDNAILIVFRGSFDFISFWADGCSSSTIIASSWLFNLIVAERDSFANWSARAYSGSRNSSGSSSLSETTVDADCFADRELVDRGCLRDEEEGAVGSCLFSSSAESRLTTDWEDDEEAETETQTTKWNRDAVCWYVNS